MGGCPFGTALGLAAKVACGSGFPAPEERGQSDALNHPDSEPSLLPIHSPSTHRSLTAPCPSLRPAPFPFGISRSTLFCCVLSITIRPTLLYTYRRCPYAMRARMGLLLAGVAFDAHEIELRNKPAGLLQASPK